MIHIDDCLRKKDAKVFYGKAVCMAMWCFDSATMLGLKIHVFPLTRPTLVLRADPVIFIAILKEKKKKKDLFTYRPFFLSKSLTKFDENVRIAKIVHLLWCFSSYMLHSSLFICVIVILLKTKPQEVISSRNQHIQIWTKNKTKINNNNFRPTDANIYRHARETQAIVLGIITVRLLVILVSAIYCATKGTRIP